MNVNSHLQPAVAAVDESVTMDNTLSSKKEMPSRNRPEDLVWLQDAGMGEFTYRYYQLARGILTVNFAALQEGAVCYPDLIKIGVALDNGEVVSYDARGFVQNHAGREAPAVSVGEEEARAALSPRLAPESHSLAWIPSDGLREVFCHEFLCRGQDGEHVLVYVDVETGMEEQILILMEDESGVLAM